MKVRTKKVAVSGIKLKKKREELKLNKRALAKIIGVYRATIYNWESGENINLGKYGDRLCSALGVDLNDLMEDAREFGPGGGIPAIRETQLQHRNQEVKERRVEPKDFSLPEAMSMVTAVLTSGTSYATALFLNIQHFDRAIRAENRIGLLEQENRRLNGKIEDLEGRLTALEDKLSRGEQEGGPAADPATISPLANGTTGT